MAKRTMTAAERARYNAARRRATAPKTAAAPQRSNRDMQRAYAAYRRKKAQEEGEEQKDTPFEEMNEEQKEAMRRRRAAAARRAAMRRKAQEKVEKGEDAPEKEQPEADIQPTEEEEKEARLRRARIARARANARKAYRKRAQEVSDDLKGPDGDSSNIKQIQNNSDVSDDLAAPTMKSDQTSQEPPASADEAEEKVLAAYALIEAQVKHSIIPADCRKQALAAKYCKQHTAKEMRFAAAQLSKVGSATKKAGNVRVQKRTAGISGKPAVKSSINDQCMFG